MLTTTSATIAQAPVPPLTDEIHALFVGGPQAWWPLALSLTHAALNIGIGIGMLLVTFWVAGWAARLTKQAVGRLHHGVPDAVLQGFIGSLVRYTVVVIGVIAVLQQIGVQTTSVLAVLGAAGLAVGLALQGGLSNVAAGVMILLLRPYRIGDRVEINGVLGKVHGLDLFVTRLHDLDNSVVFIPNSKAFGDTIINYSLEKVRRIVMDFGIDYDDDVDLALALLIQTAKTDERIVSEPAPWAKVTALCDSSVTVTLRAWTSPNGFRDTRFDLIKDVKEVFEREGLTFAFPQQVAVETRPWVAPNREAQRKAREALGRIHRVEPDQGGRNPTGDKAKGSMSELD